MLGALGGRQYSGISIYTSIHLAGTSNKNAALDDDVGICAPAASGPFFRVWRESATQQQRKPPRRLVFLLPASARGTACCPGLHNSNVHHRPLNPRRPVGEVCSWHFIGRRTRLSNLSLRAVSADPARPAR